MRPGEPADVFSVSEPASRVAQLAAVDVDIADRRLGKAAALRHRLAGRQEMPWRTRQRCRLDRVSFGILSRRHPMTSSSGKSVRWRKATIMASSIGVRNGAATVPRSIGASVVPDRERHSPSSGSAHTARRGRWPPLSTLGDRPELAASFGRRHEECLP